MGRKLTDEQKIEIVEKYKTGEYSCAKIAREYGVNPSNIQKILTKRNIPIALIANKQYKINSNYFDIIDTEDKAYFLGLMYADGYNYEKMGRFSLNLQEKDKDILDKFLQFMESNHLLYFRDRANENWQNIYSINISNKKISKRLAELGCVQAKSMILEFPTEEQVPKELQRHFIRGYFDGDGYFAVRKKPTSRWIKYSCNIVSSKNFCESLKDKVYEEIGINTTIAIPHKERNNSTRRFVVGGRIQIFKFLDWIYENATIYLERKYQKYIEARNNIPIDKIDKLFTVRGPNTRYKETKYTEYHKSAEYFKGHDLTDAKPVV